MQIDESQKLLEEIGQLLTDDTTYSGNDTLLHATLEMNCVSASIFTDIGDYVLNRKGNLRLDYALLDLWDAQESDKRWAEIQYFVHQGKFQVSFVYPEDIDSDRDPLDHRDEVVKQYFRKKRVVYYPPPHHAMEFRRQSNRRRAMRDKPSP